jgi:hypothetical protein
MIRSKVLRKLNYSCFNFTGGLFDKWMDGQLPIPEWTPLILPDEILCEELSPTSPTPTDDGGGGVAGPGNFFFCILLCISTSDKSQPSWLEP